MNYSHLTDRELLGKLIGTREARRAYQGSLAPFFTESRQLGTSHQRCILAKELIMRWLAEELKNDNVLNKPSMVRDYLRIHFAGQEHESFVALHLDAQHRLIHYDQLFRGTLTQTSVYPREVVKNALKHNAAAVVFAHNHPSGNIEPSQSDRLLTESLKQALSLVDVKVLDHFIIADQNALSFAEMGFL